MVIHMSNELNYSEMFEEFEWSLEVIWKSQALNMHQPVFKKICCSIKLWESVGMWGTDSR